MNDLHGHFILKYVLFLEIPQASALFRKYSAIYVFLMKVLSSWRTETG